MKNNLIFAATKEQENEFARLFELTGRKLKSGNCLYIEDLFLHIFDSEIIYNGSRGDFMLTNQDIGYFNIDDDDKINIIVYEFIINGNIWDAAIRLYKKIYNIE